MTDLRYPLTWPDGWPRTRHRETSRYKVSEESAKNALIHSLKLLGATDVIISTNVALRRDGLPYSNAPRPQDVGVAVYWTRAGKQECMACDKYVSIRENIRDVGAAIEALRQLERCGSSEVMKRAFVGFAALPEKAGDINWRIELGFSHDQHVYKDMVNTNYRARAKEAARSEEALLRLNMARELALKSIGLYE